jgi:hypothetical protein
LFSATAHNAEIIHHTETHGTHSFSVFSAFFAVKISLVMNSTVNGYVYRTGPTGLTGLTELTDFSLQPSALNLQLFSFQFSAFQLFSFSLQPSAVIL